MQIQGLYDIEQDIKVNGLKEVTSQQIYQSTNQYNPNGLFSEEIFGQTEEEQKYRCGYLTLPIHVFNPNIAKTIILRSGGIIRKMAYAEVRCNLTDDGVLVEAADGKYCGMKDLYAIWEHIDLRKTLKTKKDENLNILTKSPKRLLFIDKVLVLPISMRPTGIRNGRQIKSELNAIYMKLLGYKSLMSHTTSNVYKVYNQIQDSVVEIYTYIHKMLGTKHGYLQKNLLAKNTVATCRNVISAPSYREDDPEIGIFRTGYPLMSLVSMFKPFVKFHMKQFLSYNNIISFHPNPDEIRRDNIDNIYDDKMIEDLMRIFMENPGARFRTLFADPKQSIPIMFTGLNMKTKETISRPLTLTDVIYLCCYESTVKANRHVYTVRYPIGDHLGAFFTKVHVLSTITTVPVQFQNEVYRSYPDIDPAMGHMMVSKRFVDVVTMANSRLTNLNGDYDGDTIKSTGIWSDEANAEAERLMYSKAYCIRPNLTSAFPVTSATEALLGLYGLTKDIRPENQRS